MTATVTYLIYLLGIYLSTCTLLVTRDCSETLRDRPCEFLYGTLIASSIVWYLLFFMAIFLTYSKKQIEAAVLYLIYYQLSNVSNRRASRWALPKFEVFWSLFKTIWSSVSEDLELRELQYLKFILLLVLKWIMDQIIWANCEFTMIIYPSFKHPF